MNKNDHQCKAGFPKLFFLISLFKELKKAIATSNKTAQKLTFKTPKTFYLLFINNLRISSVSFKIVQSFKLAPSFAPFLFIAPVWENLVLSL